MKILLPAFLFSALLRGQMQLANVSGAVTDAQGAVIPRAAVVVLHLDTGVRAATPTNAAGFYSHRSLAIGRYRLTCEADGFRSYVRDGLTLTAGLDLEIDIQLEVGAVADSVTVTAAASLLDTRSSSSGQLVENRTIRDIPLGDRRSLNVIRLLGGSVPVATGREPQLSLAGGNAGAYMFFLDGGKARAP